MEWILKAFNERKAGVKGVCRGITFVLTASLVVLLLKSETGWHVAAVGGLVGFFAYYGW